MTRWIHRFTSDVFGDGRVVVMPIVAAIIAVVVLNTALAATTTAKDNAAASGLSGSGVSERDWGTCASAVADPARTWYLAEGCTAAGFETWILVQNPGSSPVDVKMSLQTGSGGVAGPKDTIPARTRRTYNLADYVVSYNVSTKVSASAPVVCERAMYGNSREWGTGATGVTSLSKMWYLAEGCTDGGMETWVLVQNPESTPVNVTLTLQTDVGQVAGPKDTIPPRTRRSYNLAKYAVSYNVSTRVDASGGVVCERAMYGNSREWGTDDTGASSPSTSCYLAEGCTLPDFETWVLVQNPGTSAARVRMRLLTDKGEVAGPNDSIPPGTRRTYDLSKYAPNASVATIVSSSSPVVVERSMYGGRRLWGTCSSGCTTLSHVWYLAEGCTANKFETWLALVNPGKNAVDINVKLQTDKGEVAGPSGTIQPRQRKTFYLGNYVDSFNVSEKVEASAPVACERSMYGEGTSRRPCAPVQGPPLYPITKDASIACGHWPAGSTDYPYFGAPREGTRLHAGVDIYPPGGEGTPVRAIKAGTVVKTGLFYTRANGEQTFAVLIDHGDYVATYGELRPLDAWLQPGVTVSRGQVIGYVSGTLQLHFEMYKPGIGTWFNWYGPKPADLIDPTDYILGLY